MVPDESIVYHAQRNHFSNWLKARTEFWLAHKPPPAQGDGFATPRPTCANELIASLREYRRSAAAGA